MLYFFQFRGPTHLKGAMYRGILENKAGRSYLHGLIKGIGCQPSWELKLYITEKDKVRIESEKQYAKKEAERRVDDVEKAKQREKHSGGHYKSSSYD